MIQVTGYLQKQKEYLMWYDAIDGIFGLESGCMHDNCTPRIESKDRLLTWIDNDGLLCEIECMLPKEITDCEWLYCDVETIFAAPVCTIRAEEKMDSIVANGDRLTLLIREGRRPDKKCICSDIIFYLCEDEVIAIEGPRSEKGYDVLIDDEGNAHLAG